MAFTPIRTGDQQIDRIQDRIRDAQNDLAQAQTDIAAKIPKTSDSISTRASRIIPLGTPAVTVQNTLSDVRILLPDAILARGNTMTISYVSSAGAFSTTVLPGNVSGRRQTIGGAASQTLAVGDTLVISSNGSDWLM